MFGKLAICAVVVAAALTLPQGMTHAQDPSKYPDFSGQWKKPDGVGNQWDLSRPPGRGQRPPLTSEYQAIYDARQLDREEGGLAGNHTARCVPHGVPQVMTGIYPMELIVTPKITYMLSDYDVPRRIYTDGRKFPDFIEPTFHGYSIGKWVDEDGDGRYDVLEVETRGFKSPRNFDQRGIPLHVDGLSIITERFYLDKDDPQVLRIQIKTVDNALTEPWTVAKIYRREPNPVWMFVDCAENNHHIWIGNENYYVSEDGYIMPAKKNQAPPKLKFFDQAGK